MWSVSSWGARAVGGGDRELADVVSANVGGGLAVDEGLVPEEGEWVASGGVALAPRRRSCGWS